jgi:hypothetical protein
MHKLMQETDSLSWIYENRSLSWSPHHPRYHLLNNNGLMIDGRAGKGTHAAPPDTALFDKMCSLFSFLLAEA